MSISVISFTEKGMRLSRKLAELWKGLGAALPESGKEIVLENGRREEMALYTKCTQRPEDGAAHAVTSVEQSVGEWTGAQMEAGRSLLFIGACGIAVRAIAPHLVDKLHDRPVLVMDEKGTYVIPILAGHFGGANELAGEISKVLGAVPVITTATDLNGRFAVDLFAKRNRLLIENKEGIAKVSSKALAGQEITISVETGHICGDWGLPAGVRIVPYPPKQPVDVLVTSEEKLFTAAIVLKPKNYVVGIGCRKGKEAEKIEAFILRSAGRAGIDPGRFSALASIDRKKEEQGLIMWSRKHQTPFFTYTAAELRKVEGTFQSSGFVQEKTGVDNVCERAAIKACGPAGKLLYGKHAEDGMTIAIAKKEWSVTFDEK